MVCVPALHGPAAATIPALVAVNFVFATFGQLVNVTVMAVRQAATPNGMQGRAAATITFAGMMLSPALIASSPLARLGRTLDDHCRRDGTPGAFH